ncbi:MAG: MFS transporter [Litorimonas sp.]
MSNAFDVNSKSAIVSAIILGTIGVLSFIVQPGLVQGFVTELGLNEVQANNLAFAEMVGVAIAAMVITFLSRTMNWRHLLVAALIISALGNLLSGFITSNETLKIVRFFAGLGEGGVIGLSFTFIGLSAKPERNLALYLATLLSYGAIGLWVMPTAFASIGLNGIFIIWAVLTTLALMTVKHVPTGSDSRDEPSPTAAQLHIGFLAFALLGILIYNIAIGVAWANLFLIGMSIKPDEQSIANALLLAQFIAIPGALLAAFMSDKLGRWLPLVVGILGGAVFIWLLMVKPSYSIFIMAAGGFNFMWNMALPFILASVNDMDKKSRMVTPAVSMQMIGLGFGPFFAGLILSEGGGFKAIEQFTAILLVISFAILAICILAYQKKRRTDTA